MGAIRSALRISGVRNSLRCHQRPKQDAYHSLLYSM